MHERIHHFSYRPFTLNVHIRQKIEFKALSNLMHTLFLSNIVKKRTFIVLYAIKTMKILSLII